ncbi:hypothetical protein BDW75DRAFT_245821 [Aspergillus navahoensis]
MESAAQTECGTDFNDSSGAFEFGWTGSADESAIDQTLAIGDAFQRYFNNSVNCDHNDLFAQAGRVVVGIHIDSHLEYSSASAAAIQQLTSIIKSANRVFNQTVLQVCDSGSEWTLGVSVNTQGNLTSLQKHMRTWNDGKCVDDAVSKKKIANISLRTSSRINNLSAIRNSTALEARSMSTHHGHHHHHNRALHTYHRRSTCSYVQVVSGDSCASLVQECGITTAEFTKYNPASDLCSTLAVGHYEVSVSDDEGTFSDFQKLPDMKNIISFGGWDFSTDPSTYSIFRQGVTSANRELFANNVVDFVTRNDLDSVNFDWEYPGAPDIPGIPAGSNDERDNYLKFLKLVRNGLPSDKTLSIAAPASYWYLQAFPISNISAVVDYIIYMTYDLHGQWDYGSTWAQDGCPAGDCLQSHVSLTETMLSLAMITKAGVTTKQVVVGVTSYGRGFEMTDSDCTGPMCTFTGPDSGATPGRCTNTAGYIANAEIDLLISDNNSTQVLFDSDTDSDIIIYDSVQWVAYMTNTTKSTRTEYYQSLNMAGTSEWAIDLESFGSSDANMTQWDPCTSTYATLDAIEANASNIPDYCMNTYIVGVQQAILNESLADYTDIINDGYDDKTDIYSNYIKELVPEELKSYMAANASHYFTCKTETYIQCCKDCSNAYACSSGCSSDSDCVTGYANITRVSPVIYECNDEDDFREEIEDLYRILPSWTEFGKLLVKIDAGCKGSSDPCTSSNIYYYSFPITTDFEVPNPKDLISSSLTNLTIINDMLAEAYTNMYIDIWTANECAAVDSATLPTSMTKYAVQSMAKVAAEGAAIEADEKKEMILSWYWAFSSFSPC